jgi:hypothetical protein
MGRQAKHLSRSRQRSSVYFIQHEPPASGNDQALLLGQLKSNPAFPGTKCRFAIFGKKCGNRTAVSFHNQGVGVDERPLQLPSQQLAYGCFPRAHKAGQDDVWRYWFF